MKKKRIVLLVAAFMMALLSFAACSDKDDDDLKRAADRDEVRFVAVHPSGRISEEDIDTKDFGTGIKLSNLFADTEVRRELYLTMDSTTDPSSPKITSVMGLTPAANERILVFCDNKAYASGGGTTRKVRGRTYYLTGGDLEELPFKGGTTYLFTIEANAA